MAEDKDESQEKSQEPTSKRIEKAREDGKVVSSQEMYVFVLMSAGVALMYSTPLFLSDFLKNIQNLFLDLVMSLIMEHLQSALLEKQFR